MAQITITIPDPVAQRVLDAMAVRYGWTPESGFTKAQFAKKVLTDLLKESVRMHEGNLAAQEATNITNAAVDADIVLS